MNEQQKELMRNELSKFIYWARRTDSVREENLTLDSSSTDAARFVDASTNLLWLGFYAKALTLRLPFEKVTQGMSAGDSHIDGAVYWRYSIPPTRGVKMLLLTIGGVAVVGTWEGELNESFRAWSPLPKKY